MEPLQVDVTDADIQAADGQGGVFNKCPVAQALLRLGFISIDVDIDKILMTQAEQRLFCKTPRKVELFIDDFDNDSSFVAKPFSFILDGIRLALSADERKRNDGIAVGPSFIDVSSDFDEESIEIEGDDEDDGPEE